MPSSFHEKTKSFWDRVEDTWAGDFAKDGTITLRGQVDQKKYFVPLFERSDQVEKKGFSANDTQPIRAAIDAMREAASR